MLLNRFAGMLEPYWYESETTTLEHSFISEHFLLDHNHLLAGLFI